MKHAAMFIGGHPYDGTPLAMEEAAVDFFEERMGVWCFRASHDHQGNRCEPIVQGDSPWDSKWMWVTAATEWDHRNAALSFIRAEDPSVERLWIVDTDEFYGVEDFERLKLFVESEPADAWFIQRYAYWKSPLWRIDPPEAESVVFCIDPRRVPAFTWIRFPCANRKVYASLAMQHHLTAVRSDEEMARKIRTFSHGNEFVPGWYEKVWKAWEPGMENLHPTRPENWKRAVPVASEDLPEALRHLTGHLSMA